MAVKYNMTLLARQIGITKQKYFLTRDKGELAYELIRRQLEATPEGQALVLVFPPDQLVDSSFADESAVRLGEEILNGLYGERCILFESLTEDSIKNLEGVLSLRGIKMPLLRVEARGGWSIMGNLEESLLNTLKFVHRREYLTASDLALQLKMAVNTASTRLKRLHNLHLVRREHEISEAGLQYLYYFWEWN